MRKSKKRLAALFLVFALVCTMATTLAYFTDREQAAAQGVVGTLDIVLTESWYASNTNRDNTKPGDIYNLDYTIANNGNKSADVRETFVITTTVAMTSSAPEFEIYKATDVTKGADGFYVPNTGAAPVVAVSDTTNRVLAADGKTLTYHLPEFILDGTGPGAEDEPEADSNADTFDYVILFSKSASNDWQGAEVTIDYLVEAKQHRNTDDSIWATVASEEIDFAGSKVNAVPVA